MSLRTKDEKRRKIRVIIKWRMGWTKYIDSIVQRIYARYNHMRSCFDNEIDVFLGTA